MSNEELAMLIKQGQREYLPMLWEQVYKLIYRIASNYYSRYNERFISCGICFEDLQQECYFVFLNMVEVYNPEKEYRFTTYAKYQFKHHLNRLLQINGNFAENPLNVCDSLSRTMTGYEDEELTLSETICDESAEFAYENADDKMYQMQLHDALDTVINEVLPEKRQIVIRKRFFDNLSQKETGNAVGISFQRVQQLERYSLRDLKKHCDATHELDSFRNETLTEHAYEAYHNGGIGNFRNSGASTVELAYERAMRDIGRYKRERIS